MLLFLEILLSVLMVFDCVILVFLVLIQLPKKEAGAGLAFGGSATDALFGAGSGNVLTKITKYAATVFFIMAVLLSILQSRFHTRSSSAFQRQLEQARPPANTAIPTPPPGTAPVNPSNSPAVPATNLLITPQPEATNVPGVQATPTNA